MTRNTKEDHYVNSQSCKGLFEGHGWITELAHRAQRVKESLGPHAKCYTLQKQWRKIKVPTRGSKYRQSHRMTTQRCNIATETETQTKRQTMTKKSGQASQKGTNTTLMISGHIKRALQWWRDMWWPKKDTKWPQRHTKSSREFKIYRKKQYDNKEANCHTKR